MLLKQVKKILDRRSDEGGYYEAKCDHCGTLYYPKSALSKYCSRACAVQAYRKRNGITGTAVKQPKTVEGVPNKKENPLEAAKKVDTNRTLNKGESLIGNWRTVLNYFRKYKIISMMDYSLKSRINQSKTGEKVFNLPYTVIRLSTNRYKVTRD